MFFSIMEYKSLDLFSCQSIKKVFFFIFKHRMLEKGINFAPDPIIQKRISEKTKFVVSRKTVVHNALKSFKLFNVFCRCVPLYS